jgi:hypothetical protein
MDNAHQIAKYVYILAAVVLALIALGFGLGWLVFA